MKYVDVFKKPLAKEDVATAARLMVREKNTNTSLLTRRLRWGYGKALNIVMLLMDAGVICPTMNGRRSLLLKQEDAAVNAALRQLRKGNG